MIGGKPDELSFAGISARAAASVDNAEAIDSEWLKGVRNVAVTAGASAPEILVEGVIDYLKNNGFGTVEEVEVMPENVRFGLPPEIVQAIQSAPASTPAGV